MDHNGLQRFQFSCYSCETLQLWNNAFPVNSISYHNIELLQVMLCVIDFLQVMLMSTVS